MNVTRFYIHQLTVGLKKKRQIRLITLIYHIFLTLYLFFLIMF